MNHGEHGAHGEGPIRIRRWGLAVRSDIRGGFSPCSPCL